MYAIDGFCIYCREYIDQFINDLPSVSLNESEVVMLLNDTTIDKHFKPEILKKISAGIMTKKLAQTIASNQFISFMTEKSFCMRIQMLF